MVSTIKYSWPDYKIIKYGNKIVRYDNKIAKYDYSWIL